MRLKISWSVSRNYTLIEEEKIQICFGQQTRCLCSKHLVFMRGWDYIRLIRCKITRLVEMFVSIMELEYGYPSAKQVFSAFHRVSKSSDVIFQLI